MFSRRSLAQQVEALFSGKPIETVLSQTCENVKIEVLGRLHKIRSGFVSNWLADDRQMFNQLGEADRIALRNALEEVFKDGKDIAMEDWFNKARPVLLEAGIGV